MVNIKLKSNIYIKKIENEKFEIWDCYKNVLYGSILDIQTVIGLYNSGMPVNVNIINDLLARKIIEYIGE